MRPAPHRVITASTGLVAVGILTAEVWAMAAPRSFYLTIAPYSPYSQHLIRDIGAFQIGLGACLVAGLLVRHALLTVLAGNTAAAVAHSVSHVVDRSAGRRLAQQLPELVLHAPPYALEVASLCQSHVLRFREPDQTL